MMLKMDYAVKTIAGRVQVDHDKLRSNDKWQAYGFGNLVYQLAFSAYDYLDVIEKDRLAEEFSVNKSKWPNGLKDQRDYFAAGVQLYFDGGCVYGICNRTGLQNRDGGLAKIVYDVFRYGDKKQWTVPGTRWGWLPGMSICGDCK